MSSTYEEAVATGKLPEAVCRELEQEEWSKVYTDIREMLKDLLASK